MEEKFNFSNALKQIRAKESFMPIKLESKLLKLGKEKREKSTGGFLIPLEFSKLILLSVAISNWKVTKKLSRKDLITLVEDWERTNELNKKQRDTITKLEKSLKWYKQRHKNKKEK